MTDIVQEEEDDDSDEGDQQLSISYEDAAFLHTIFAAAQKHNAVIVEYYTCPKCSFSGYSAHTFSERLLCQNPKCCNSMVSKVPRPPLKGDTTTAHWETAVATLLTVANQRGLVTKPLTQEETDKLSPDAALAVAKMFVKVQKETLENVVNLVKALVERGIDG